VTASSLLGRGVSCGSAPAPKPTRVVPHTPPHVPSNTAQLSNLHIHTFRPQAHYRAASSLVCKSAPVQEMARDIPAGIPLGQATGRSMVANTRSDSRIRTSGPIVLQAAICGIDCRRPCQPLAAHPFYTFYLFVVWSPQRTAGSAKAISMCLIGAPRYSFRNHLVRIITHSTLAFGPYLEEDTRMHCSCRHHVNRVSEWWWKNKTSGGN